MIAAVTNGRRYAWDDWLLGLWRSLVSGGAGAVVSSVQVSIKDPKDWGFHSWNTLELIASTFLITGIIHMAVFLQTHPAPEPIKETA